MNPALRTSIWEFPKTRVPYFGVLIIRIPLFRVLKKGPLFSETPISLSGGDAEVFIPPGPAVFVSGAEPAVFVSGAEPKGPQGFRVLGFWVLGL